MAADNVTTLRMPTSYAYGGSGTLRPHEQFAYGYDKAWNLRARTNNALVQAFAVNNLNQLSNVVRSGTLTVAGYVTKPASSVTVSGTADFFLTPF